jgi:hypothetical protein
MERHLFISGIAQGRTDDRNPLRRFREVPRAVRYRGVARRLQREGLKGLKLKRSVTMDPCHRSRRIYT